MRTRIRNWWRRQFTKGNLRYFSEDSTSVKVAAFVIDRLSLWLALLAMVALGGSALLSKLG